MTDKQHVLINGETQPSFELRDGRCCLRGHLNYNNVNDYHQRLVAGLNSEQSITFDLSGLDHSNSAVIALLVEWIKRSQMKQFELKLTNVPDRMLSIIQAAGLQPLFSDLIL